MVTSLGGVEGVANVLSTTVVLWRALAMDVLRSSALGTIGCATGRQASFSANSKVHLSARGVSLNNIPYNGLTYSAFLR